MDIAPLNTQLDAWFPLEQRARVVEQLAGQVGLTRVRADYFVRLWVYLLIKQQQTARQADRQPHPQTSLRSPAVPFTTLTLPAQAISCSHREAAQIFYGDKDTGSDRAAGMMLDKLAALGLIKKHFDGNMTRIEVQLSANVLETITQPSAETGRSAKTDVIVDDFDPRCDAVPVAHLLATNYGWMTCNLELVPHRITRLLRGWANQYATGMRVLRRKDNLNPVGFYLLYPTTAESEIAFSSAPSKGLHLANMSEIDPFTLATPGDPNCSAVFIRSWMIDPAYLDTCRTLFLQDAQHTLKRMQEKDFLNLCDLYTLIIHPSYEAMAIALGFQKIGPKMGQKMGQTHHPGRQIYWMYQALDRYLGLDLETRLL